MLGIGRPSFSPVLLFLLLFLTETNRVVLCLGEWNDLLYVYERLATRYIRPQPDTADVDLSVPEPEDCRGEFLAEALRDQNDPHVPSEVLLVRLVPPEKLE
ncbi:MAG: hypothetical protein JW395_2545 [Nitrospira sp.]|nr:hypothetical protein [Nitrospira sp.]